MSAPTLTDEQEQAAERRQGSLLLAAGAGSGKTSVLVERFVRAVRLDGISPGRILAITFTDRAAGELRERVRTRLLELGERDTARDAEAAFVSTFHGFCARLLRIHPLQAGVEPGFQILDESFAGRLRMLAFADALTSFVRGERAEAVDLVAAYGPDPLRALVFGAYAQLRSQGQVEPRLPRPSDLYTSGPTNGLTRVGVDERESHPADRPARRAATRAPAAGGAIDTGQTKLWEDEPPSPEDTERHDGEAQRTCELIGELMELFGEAYTQRKHARAALDFDDLELLARELLEHHADVRDTWANRFELLMVDEFQDTNPRQLHILAALDRDNLFTVGDELQSIYSFRHADVKLFRERQAQLEEQGASLALTNNFRSAPAILTAVDRLFAKRMGERFTSFRTMRVSQENDSPIVELLLTDKRGWEERPVDEELEGLPAATPWRQAEARALAARVAELVENRQARAGEVVVLLRALPDLPVYETALRRLGLRTLAGVGGFWSHQQVGDLLAWLRALANPHDELSLYSTLASPLVGLSSDGLVLVSRFARQGGGGVWQTIDRQLPHTSTGSQVTGEHAGGASGLLSLLGDDDRLRLERFARLFAAERSTAALHPISELLRRAIAATGYESHVLSLNWGERRLANVHKLIRLSRSFEAREGRHLRRFLDHVAHVESAFGAREPDAPVGDGDGEHDAVRLMSIHAAKGLEFPVVCVADLGRDPNLRQPDLLVDGARARLGVRLLSLHSPEPVSALHYEELRHERRAAQEEEEDRVLYVACTRAQNRLLLSGAVSFERWPSPKPGVAPIAWLAPALVPDAPALAAAAERPGVLTVDMGEGLRVRCAFNAPTPDSQPPLFDPGALAARPR